MHRQDLPMSLPTCFRGPAAALILALLGAGALACGAAEPGSRSCGPARAASAAEAARLVLPSVVSLDLEDRAGARSFAAALVYRADGTLITAAHAAQPGTRITVLLADGSRLPATVVGRDELSDVAVLKIVPPAPLHPVRLAAGPVEAGEPVAAIGDPLGYRLSLTAGIVSTPRRAYGPVNPYDHIQHDAALNPGSSGGALVNAAGAVIGMNVAIADGSRRHVGIGLAVPAPVVARIAERLIRDGAIARPALGLRLRDAASLDPAAGTAPLIEDVAPGSAAFRAGLRPGMAIRAANGQPVQSPRDLARALEPLAPGAGVALDLVSGPTALSVHLTLEAPVQSGLRTRSLKAAGPAGPLPFVHGVVLVSGGARVVRVEAQSAAAAAGLKAGDEVLAVGARPVDAAGAQAELDRAVGTRLALLVRRDGVSRYVVLGAQGRIDSAQPFGANAEAEGSSQL